MKIAAQSTGRAADDVRDLSAGVKGLKKTMADPKMRNLVASIDQNPKLLPEYLRKGIEESTGIGDVAAKSREIRQKYNLGQKFKQGEDLLQPTRNREVYVMPREIQAPTPEQLEMMEALRGKPLTQQMRSPTPSSAMERANVSGLKWDPNVPEQ